ncbi:MAG: peptidylprolyl isomerase [Rhodobacter sp.]|nr:peptidylprolyl isomerase [Gammaproteobacteria bacterium]MDJ0828129.1 peptidylprolyl isomerase [Rhodobacter sp.]
MSITQNKVVSIHYNVVDADSEESIDSSDGRDPMVYLHGARNIIPGLEQALEGKAAGDAFDVTVAAVDAYGEHSDDRVQKVPREAFAEISEVYPGLKVTAQTDMGPIELLVTEVADDEVTVDANHPLAGRNLKFSVRVEDVRDASEEEVAHGHVHGPGGQEH